MGRNGESGGEDGARSISECCMCGDYGLSSHLFICQRCGFRSQHKYCSNLYPLAESYHTCNWCLSKKEDKKTTDQVNNNNNNIVSTKTCPSYSSHHHHKENDIIVKTTNKKKRVLARDSHGGFIKDKKTSSGDQIIKMKSVDESRAGGNNRTWSGKKIIRRTRSDEISNGGGIVVKQVFRNKVRRYKHLDEVSC